MKAVLDGSSPIFLQVKEAIEADILSGALAPDEQIPSNRKLVALWEVNPVTVLKGVGLLVEEGILYKKRGEGMFVAPDAQGRLRQRIGDIFSRQHIEPLVRLAVAIGLNADTLCAKIRDVWEEITDD